MQVRCSLHRSLLGCSSMACCNNRLHSVSACGHCKWVAILLYRVFVSFDNLHSCNCGLLCSHPEKNNNFVTTNWRKNYNTTFHRVYFICLNCPRFLLGLSPNLRRLASIAGMCTKSILIFTRRSFQFSLIHPTQSTCSNTLAFDGKSTPSW